MKPQPLLSLEDPDWLTLRTELWPDTLEAEHLEEMAGCLAAPERFAQFILRSEGQAGIGFVEVSIRSDYVNGTNSSPVAFLEGLYVKSMVRRQGTARALVAAAAEWAKTPRLLRTRFRHNAFEPDEPSGTQESRVR